MTEKKFQDFYHDGRTIYQLSAERIANMIDFNQWQDQDEKRVVERIIHAVADTSLINDIIFQSGAAHTIARALKNNAPILCDSHMTFHGLLDCNNQKVSLIDELITKELSIKRNITRSHAQIYLWQDMLKEKLSSAIIVIGNAPTCLYGLLQEWQKNMLRPAGIIAMPVGFVGASESKDALIHDSNPPPFITLKGVRGGSAIASATLNALLSQKSLG